MSTTVFQMRIDETLKNEATKLYDAIGLDLPTAIRMFLKKSISEQGLPFSTRINTKQRGIELLNEFSKEARMNQISSMTLDEINSEIEKFRTGV